MIVILHREVAGSSRPGETQTVAEGNPVAFGVAVGDVEGLHLNAGTDARVQCWPSIEVAVTGPH